jgi:hemolysin III
VIYDADFPLPFSPNECNLGPMYALVRFFAKHLTVEELANTLTHGFGLICSLLGFALLLTLALLRGGKWQLISCAIYGASLVCLYAASTLYHGVSSPRFKRALLTFDHCAINLLIAGTYTPFLLVNLRGSWGWSLFGVIWTMAVFSILLKLWFAERFRIFSTFLYLSMGWLGVIVARPVYSLVPSAGLRWLFLGGAMYTIGVIFYAWKKIPYHHAIWHVLVMAGSTCHYIAILYSVFPRA